MYDVFRDADLFQGLPRRDVQRISTVGRSRVLSAGDYLFLLGDSAECVYVVVQGIVELCLPMMLGGILKDIPVESASAGRAVGWSALVKPYRFTLSARAVGSAEVIGLPRGELQQIFARAPGVGYRLQANLSELIGVRLHAFQALWVRELQRTLLNESRHHANVG